MFSWSCIHMQILHFTRQTPSRYGTNQDRIIFTTKLGRPTKDLYVGCSPQGDDSDVLVYGGLAHGISVFDVLLVCNIDAGRTFTGKATVQASYATCATIAPDPLIRDDRTFYCKLIPNYDTLRVYYDLSTVTNLLDAVHPYYTAQPENAFILISIAPGFDSRTRTSFHLARVATTTCFLTTLVIAF